MNVGGDHPNLQSAKRTDGAHEAGIIKSPRSPASIRMLPEPIWEPLPVGAVRMTTMEAVQIAGFFADSGTSSSSPSGPPRARDKPDDVSSPQSPPAAKKSSANPEANSNTKQYLEDHHVVLKEHGDTTPATRLFKDHTRAVFPRSEAFDMDDLINLQNQLYRCKYPCRASLVEFWVSEANAKMHPEWTVDCTRKRYGRKKDVAFVPASPICIRHEIVTSGGRMPHERSSSQTKAAKKGQIITSAGYGTLELPGPNKRFKVKSLENINKQLTSACDQWIQESTDLYDKGGRKEMVEQFWKDLAKEKKMLERNALVSNTTTDGYTQTRQTAHDRLLVHIANELGNAMVDWYQNQKGGQQPQRKKKKPALKAAT